MKLGAIIPVLNEWKWVPAIARQLFKICDRVLIMRGMRSLSGATPPELSPVPYNVLPRNTEVFSGAWQSEHETRNSGMALLSDCGYVLHVDSDELIPDDGLESIKRGIATGAHGVVCRMHTYWKSIEYRIDPPEPLVALVAARKDVRFSQLRQPDVPKGGIALVDRRIMHHLSYVRTDEEMREKLRTFGHAKEVIPGWYERVWKAWDENHDLENLHPTHPGAYQRAVRDAVATAAVEAIIRQ